MNPNNFYALSLRSKALIALDREIEAYTVIKKALSIKYSKSLIKSLKEIEDKFHLDKSEKSVTEESFEKTEQEEIETIGPRSYSPFLKFLNLLFFGLKEFLR